MAKPAEEGGGGTPVRTPGAASGGRGAGLAKELARARERITQVRGCGCLQVTAVADLRRELTRAWRSESSVQAWRRHRYSCHRFSQTLSTLSFLRVTAWDDSGARL